MTKQAKRRAKANKSARKKKARDNYCAIDLDNIDDSDIGSFFESDSECEMLERPVQKERKKAGASASEQQKKRKKATGKKPSVACQGMQDTGIPCGNKAKDGTKFCGRHRPKVSGACQGMQQSGIPCGNKAKDGTKFCGRHQPKATKPQARPAATKTQAPPAASKTNVESPICLARMPVFGPRCNMHRMGESRFCAEHRPWWHQKDSPIWDLLPATMVPDSDPTICLAWVTSTGLRCSNMRYGPSRWCVEHFNEWHGKDSPAWRPCPP